MKQFVLFINYLKKPFTGMFLQYLLHVSWPKGPDSFVLTYKIFEM